MDTTGTEKDLGDSGALEGIGMATKYTAGRFEVSVSDDGQMSIAGPRAYMESDAYARVCAGLENSTVVRMSLAHGSPLGLAVAVAVQTDFAAWRGYQELRATL